MLFGSKKVKTEKLIEEDDFDDILDLDADMDDLGLGPSDAQSKIKNFNSGFRRGFNTDINRKHALNGLMAGALPDEYAHLYSTGLNARHIIRDDIRKARHDNAEVLLSMVERSERILPKMRRFTPGRIYAKFEENLERSRQSLSEEVESKANTRQGTQASSADEDTIRDALLDVTAYSDAQAATRDQDNYLKETAQRTLQSEIERTRFGTTAEQLGTIASSLERQNAFQDSITYRYQRKSLEVQYRSLFMLRDIRKLTGANLDLHRRGYEALVHNTGLTGAQLRDHAVRSFRSDHLKDVAHEAGVGETATKGSFSYGNAIRQGLTFGATQGLQQKLPQYLSGYMPEVRKRIQTELGNFLSGIDTSADMAEAGAGAAGGIDGDGTARMGGQGIGGTLGKLFGTYVAPRVGRLARPGLDRLNGNMGGRGHLASYFINNAPSILQDFSRNQSSEDSGLMGLLRGGVRALTPTYYREDELKDGSYQTIDREVSFNHLSQRSLVEIIPGYLSRMLHEARMLRTGDTSIEREVYDVTKGTFTTVKGARQSMRDRIIPEGQRDSVTTTLDGIMNTYVGDDNLSDEAKFALREQLMMDAGSGGRFDPVKYAAGGFDASTPDETVKELTDFFKRQFKYDDDGKLVKEYENLRQLDEYAQEFSRLRDIMPDPREEIARLHGAGSQELMRDLGITYTRNGRDYTDFSQIWKMYRGDDEVIGGEEQPLPNRPDLFASQGSSTTTGTPDVTNDHFTDHLTKLFADTQRHLNDAMNRVSEKLCDHPIFYEKCCDPCGDPKARKRNVTGDTSVPNNEDVDAKPSDLHTVNVTPKPTVSTPKWKERLKPRTDHLKEKVEKITTPWFAKTRTITDPVNQESLDNNELVTPTTDTDEGVIFVNRKGEGSIAKPSSRPFHQFYTQAKEKTTLETKGSDTPTTTHKADQASSSSTKLDPMVTRASNFRDFLSRTKEQVTDIFTSGGKRTLLKRDIIAGLYIDKKSQQVIYEAKDIHGEVIDRDGNVVLTEAEYQEGLYNVENVSIKTRSHLSSLLDSGNTQHGKVSGIKETLDNLRDRAKKANDTRRKVTGAISDYFNKDAYFPGEESPRIRIVAMKDGEYTNRKGKVIRRISDVRGSVFDKDLNVVVSDEDLPHLVTVEGKPHAIAKNTKGLRRITSKLAQGAGKYLDWTKNYYKKLPGRLWRGAKGTTKFIANPIKTTLGMDSESPTIMDGVRKRGSQAARLLDIGMNDGRNLSPTAVNPGAPYDNDDEIDPRDLKWMTDDDKPVDDDAIKTPTDGLLNRINETLERAYPDPHRKGSWQQILADRRAKREEEKANKKDEGDEKPFANVFDQMKDAFGGLKDMFSKGAGGLMDMLGLGGDGPTILGNPLERGSRPPSRPNNAPKPKGWLRKAGGLALKYGWMGGVFLGKGALALGTAAVSTVGLPVIIGAAAVAGIVGGGVYLYNRHQETAGELYRWRFAQYGIDPVNRDQAIPVLALEKHMEDVTTRNGPNDITVDRGSMNVEEIMEMFGLEEATQERIDEFNQWWDGRFMPVYLAHQRALVTVKPSVKLTDIDEALEKEEGRDFMEAVVIPGEILANMASPFGAEYPLTVTNNTIKEYFDEAKAEYRVPDRQRDRRNAGPGQGYRNIHPGETPDTGGSSDPSTPASGGGTLRHRSSSSGTLGMSTQALVESTEIPDTHLRSNTVSPGRNVIPSPLQAMRLHGYGLERLESRWANILLTLEARVMEYVSIDQNGQAEFKGNANTHLQEIAGLLGIAWSVDREEAQRWRYWFVSRFIPVVLAYVSSMHNVAPALALGGSGASLSKEQRLTVARAIMGAQSNQGDEDVPVWDIITEVMTDQDRSLAESNAQTVLLALEEETRNNQASPGHSPQSLQQRQQHQRELEQRVTQGSGNTPASTNHYQSYIQARQQMMGGGGNSHSLGLGGNTSPLSPGGQAGPRGNVYGGLAEGNGGAWEDLPVPTKDADRDAAMPTLRGVEEMTGVDANLLATFAKIESNFRATVKASTSSATGWFQFLNATWDEMLEKHGAKYGIPTNLPQEQRRELRKDPRINALMGAEFLKGNHRYLSRHIGREPTDTDLYLAHFMGMGGAKQLLTSDMNARADQIFPAPARANPTVFYHGGDRSRPRSVADIVTWADSKVAPGRTEGGGANVFSATTPDAQLTPDTSPTPQVDISGVEAMNQRQVVQVAPDGATGAYQFADDNEVAAEVSEHLANANQSQRSVPGVDPASNNTITPGTLPPAPTFTPIEEEVAEVIQPQQQRRQQVLETERRQRERLEESVVETQAMGSIAQQQLETQREMRDYLMSMAASMGIIQESGVKIRQEEDPNRSPGDTSIPTTPATTRQRQTGNVNAPVSMSST